MFAWPQRLTCTATLLIDLFFPTGTYHDHECNWNGPSWPYETSRVLTAMANLLNNYPSQTAVDPALYQDVLWQYMRQVGIADGPTFSRSALCCLCSAPLFFAPLLRFIFHYCYNNKPLASVHHCTVAHAIASNQWNVALDWRGYPPRPRVLDGPLDNVPGASFGQRSWPQLQPQHVC